MHSDQKRLSGDPYFSHPIAVAQLLAGMGADSDTIIAALLHDTVEDTPLTLREIEDQFGSDVRLLIEGVTKLTEDELNAQPTRDEQVETLRKIFTLMQNDVRIMVIKLADRLHNIQTVAHLPDARRTVYARETLDIYAKIAERLCMRDMRDALMALCYRALEPETFLRMEREEQECHTRASGIIESMAQRLAENCSCLPHRANMLYEQRSWDHIRAQLDLRGAVVSGFPTLSIVFVCESLDHCYRMLGCLHQTWLREAMSFQDYMNTQALNGYKGLHTTIILEDGTRVRCKIRTYDMQHYARNGIATRCFADRASPLADLLPWTKRIAPMVHDTRTVKEDFWESLVNDILGDSIVIHGTGDQSILVPKIATALDAAFYFFNETALRASAIKLNGKIVPPYAPIAHADSIDITLADAPQFSRKWLDWVETGLGITRVQQALEQQPREQKIASGKNLIELFFAGKKQGLVQEFNERTLRAVLAELGHSSLEDMYIAVAEARREPHTLFSALFQKPATVREHLCVIRFRMNTLDSELVRSIELIYQNFSKYLLEIRQNRNQHDPYAAVRIRMKIDSQQQRTIVSLLQRAGALDVYLSTEQLQYKLWGIVCFLIVVWSLDPVIAKYLLDGPYGVSPLSFTFMRFLSFFLLSLVIFAAKAKPQKILERLPWNDPLLWLSGFTFMLVGLSTYVTLETIMPMQYIIFVCASAVVIPIITQSKRSPLPLRTIGFCLFLTLGSLALLGMEIASRKGFFAGLILTASFAIFTASIDAFKRRHHIAARLPSLLFALSVITLLFSSPLLLALKNSHVSLGITGVLLLYGIIVTGLPYHLYYRLLTTQSAESLGQLFCIGMIITILGQVLLFHSIHWLSLLAFGPILLSIFLLTRHYRYPAAPQFSDSHS